MQKQTKVLSLCVLFLCSTLATQALLTTSPMTEESNLSSRPTPGNTLISIQSYRTDGRLLEVSPDKNVVWQFDPPNSNVFDAEVLDNGNILVTVATNRKPQNCPSSQLKVDKQECVQNRVLELDYRTKNVVWQYSWFDEYLHNHEVHDIDRLKSGKTAIIDMGNDRAFVVNQSGEITWEWKAKKHLTNGTEFASKYGYEPNPGGEKDWTHMNDIDQLSNGNFQISVRNFDSVIEVNPKTHKIENVIGKPGKRQLLYEQHNPDRIPGVGTTLVADSENDRIVEIDMKSEKIIWKYGGSSVLNWPRDADRLPNNDTLIADSFNNRVVEINQRNEIVWQFSANDLVYSADRIGVPEDSRSLRSGRSFKSDVDNSFFLGIFKQLQGYGHYIFPKWMHLPELVNLLLLVIGMVSLLYKMTHRIPELINK